MKIVDFLAGIVVLFLGLMPFLARIEAIASKISFIGSPGGTVYQTVLIILGVLLIAYSLKQPKSS